MLLSKNEPVIDFTTYDITSKFEAFPKNKMDALYLTERIQIEWMQTLDEYWDGVDTLYPGVPWF